MYDEAFSGASGRFFDGLLEERHVVLVSEITARELQGAPLSVRQFVAGLPDEAIERIGFTGEMADLRDGHLSAEVVGPASSDDAAHVACATVAHADLMISWNFRHLVNWEKMRAFNAVNLRLGYPLMTILSPREVITDEGV